MQKKVSTEVLTRVKGIDIKLDWVQKCRLNRPGEWYTEMYLVGLYHENGTPINVFDYGERECGGQFAYRVEDFTGIPESERCGRETAALNAALHRLRKLRQMLEDGARV